MLVFCRLPNFSQQEIRCRVKNEAGYILADTGLFAIPAGRPCADTAAKVIGLLLLGLHGIYGSQGSSEH